MKYFLPALLAGILINPFVFTPKPGPALIPRWTGSIDNIGDIEPVPEKKTGKAGFLVTTQNGIRALNRDGRTAGSAVIDEGLFATSGDGNYFVRYEKVGTSLEFYSIRGERFWKIDGGEYPYLSSGGRIILLMNGDHTVIRVADYNGNITGAKQIVGRLCTAISFSGENDRSALGFLDGSYHVLDGKGRSTNNGAVPEGFIVKGVAVSDSGSYGAVHYGNPEKDFIRIINIKKNVFDTAELDQVHGVKTSLHVNGRGETLVLEKKSVKMFTRSGRVKFFLAMDEKRPGYSSISEEDGIYAVGYTGSDGAGRFLVITAEGQVLFSRTWSPESFISAEIKGDTVFLRGSDNLYCYTLQR